MLNNCIAPFLEQAQLNPLTPAFKCLSGLVNYGDFETEIKRTAGYFVSKGIKKGDRVLILVPMSVDLYRNVMALFYIGAVAVFVDQWVSLGRFRLCCRMADCKGIILAGKLRLISWIFPETRKIPVKLSAKEKGKYTRIDAAQMEMKDAALITFTTGSTGVPKAAERSHGFLLKQLKAVSAELNAKPGETDLTNLPIVLLCNLGNGTSSLLLPIKAGRISNEKADSFLKQVIENKVNRITGSPYFLVKLAERAKALNLRFPELKYVLTGGGPVFPDDAIELMNAFPKAQIKIIYGSTEAEPIATVTAEVLSQQVITSVSDGLLVGYGADDINVKILKSGNYPHEMSDDELNDSACRVGESGELIVSGSHVLDRYFRNDVAFSQNKIISGNILWHRTGDAGFFDDAGLLYLCGRVKHIFYSNGLLVCPFIVEHLLKQINGIAAGAVVKNGNQTIVFLELAGNNDDAYLRKIHEIIPGVTDVKVIKSMPRDSRHFTKIDYDNLINLTEQK